VSTFEFKSSLVIELRTYSIKQSSQESFIIGSSRPFIMSISSNAQYVRNIAITIISDGFSYRVNVSEEPVNLVTSTVTSTTTLSTTSVVTQILSVSGPAITIFNTMTETTVFTTTATTTTTIPTSTTTTPSTSLNRATAMMLMPASIGGIIIVVAAIGFAIWYYRRRRTRKSPLTEADEKGLEHSSRSSGIDTFEGAIAPVPRM
jgi:hypothetical protein